MGPVCLFRIPLMRGKSARQLLEERGLFEEYRRRFPYDPAAKFLPRNEQSAVPMTFDPDVSSIQPLHTLPCAIHPLTK